MRHLLKFSLYLEGKYVNKFDFEIDKEYEYWDLPKQCQKDISVQFDEHDYEENPEDYRYKFKLLNREELEDWLSQSYGDYFGDECEHAYMKRLIKSIEKKGLDYPSVGSEGNHRALAFWYLGKDLPYLEFVRKTDDEIDAYWNDPSNQL